MKQILVLLLMAAALVGCSKERANFKEVLTQNLSKDSDLLDYNLSAEEMADCVVNAVDSTLPGFKWAPARNKYYEAYAKLVSPAAEENPQEALKEAESVFGSIREAREAAMGVTNFIMDCMAQQTPEGGRHRE